MRFTTSHKLLIGVLSENENSYLGTWEAVAVSHNQWRREFRIYLRGGAVLFLPDLFTKSKQYPEVDRV